MKSIFGILILLASTQSFSAEPDLTKVIFNKTEYTPYMFSIVFCLTWNMASDDHLELNGAVAQCRSEHPNLAVLESEVPYPWKLSNFQLQSDGTPRLSSLVGVLSCLQVNAKIPPAGQQLMTNSGRDERAMQTCVGPRSPQRHHFMLRHPL